MIQSAAYDSIKREGIQEGLQRGMQQGLERGLELGLERGRQLERERVEREMLLQAIAFGLDVRFGNQGLRLLPVISRIEDKAMLHVVMERLKTAPDAEDLRALYLSEDSPSPHVRN